MISPFYRFILQLTIAVCVVFGIHLSALYFFDSPIFDNKIILAYLLNYILAISIYSILYIYRIKLKNQLGFLFMGGSSLKFMLFFVFFYSSYKADGNINSLEFAAFFTPYIVCLTLETAALVKLLNGLK